MTAIDAMVRPVAGVELTVRPDPHVFSDAERAAIDARFAAMAAANPKLWNGPIFLFDAIAFGEGGDGPQFRGEAAATDFASFLHWRATMPPDPRFQHVFPVGAVVSSDGRLMVGRMAAHTANPGRLYPPAGSFDPSDLVTAADGRLGLDAEANMAREIGEEVGIDVAGWARDPGWVVLGNGPSRHALVRIFRAEATAAELELQALAHLASDPEPELDGILFVPPDTRLDPVAAVPYVNVLLAHLQRTG